MESRDSSKLQITLLRYDIHIVAGLFVLQYLPDYLALTIILIILTYRVILIINIKSMNFFHKSVIIR